jgi:hypothetical protein
MCPKNKGKKKWEWFYTTAYTEAGWRNKDSCGKSSITAGGSGKGVPGKVSETPAAEQVLQRSAGWGNDTSWNAKVILKMISYIVYCFIGH